MHKGMLTLPHPCVIRKKTNSWEKVCERHYQTSQRIPGGHLSLSLSLCVGDYVSATAGEAHWEVALPITSPTTQDIYTRIQQQKINL